MGLVRQITRLLGLGRRLEADRPAFSRGRIDHVIILDGTMSTLEAGRETNAGQLYRMLCAAKRGASISLKYEAGIQWRGFRHAVDVIAGVGINKQIMRAYGFLASRYREGDRIFLFGYSRGGYGVRSLAGVIDRIGLLRADCATERNILQIYRHYSNGADSPVAREFARINCHPKVEIEMVGIWDTVRALGFRAPLLWRLFPDAHAFHDHSLGKSIRHGYQALALDENRLAYAPVLWQCPPEWDGDVEQVWFHGTHGDVGGHLGGYEAARPLANIPLVWMAGKAENLGLALPEGWRDKLPGDVNAPSMGTLRGWGKMFLFRWRRTVGRDRSERIHESVTGRRVPKHMRPKVVPQTQTPEEAHPAKATQN